MTETPDEAFERNWALTLIEKVFERLEAESATCGRNRMFAELKSAMAGDKDGVSYAELAKLLGLSEGAVKMSVYRLRGRCRELFRQEVAQMVERPEDVDDEIGYLFRVLSR